MLLDDCKGKAILSDLSRTAAKNVHNIFFLNSKKYCEELGIHQLENNFSNRSKDFLELWLRKHSIKLTFETNEKIFKIDLAYGSYGETKIQTLSITFITRGSKI